jgi:hypothetical protein
MPFKPHPTDPDKMVYVSRQYDIPQLQGVTVTPEDEEFNRIEREAKQRMVAVRYAVAARKRGKEDDDDIQGFMPDWANFHDGVAVGRSAAFEEIKNKIKAMPFNDDTIGSLLIWLKEQE